MRLISNAVKVLISIFPGYQIGKFCFYRIKQHSFYIITIITSKVLEHNFADSVILSSEELMAC